MVSYMGSIIAGNLIAAIWVWVWHKPWLAPDPRTIGRDAANKLLSQGVLFFVLQAANFAVYNSDNLMISHYLGAGHVTSYSVARRISAYLAAVQSLVIASSWPAYAEAFARGDIRWIRKLYRKQIKFTLVCVGVLSFLLALGGKDLIRLWAGQAAVPDAPVLWCMCLWAVLAAYTATQGMLLGATGRIHVQVVFTVLAAIANLGGSIVLVQRVGALGVILSTVLSSLLLVLIPQAIETRRILSQSEPSSFVKSSMMLDSSVP